MIAISEISKMWSSWVWIAMHHYAYLGKSGKSIMMHFETYKGSWYCYNVDMRWTTPIGGMYALWVCNKCGVTCPYVAVSGSQGTSQLDFISLLSAIPMVSLQQGMGTLCIQWRLIAGHRDPEPRGAIGSRAWGPCALGGNENCVCLLPSAPLGMAVPWPEFHQSIELVHCYQWVHLTISLLMLDRESDHGHYHGMSSLASMETCVMFMQALSSVNLILAFTLFCIAWKGDSSDI